MSLSIHDVCDIMRDEENGSALDRFALVNSKVMEDGGVTCMNHEFSNWLALLTDESWVSTLFNTL